ncbi:hypothetical protein MNBD_NITROSPINAE03-1964 [hydrothermal vent metagenome]|uniref:Uncharacterized protein n=1 Tax=hydrothermal vent metagenome TaxID=652676 RepID=A0A3B1CVL4_9ZZZZ
MWLKYIALAVGALLLAFVARAPEEKWSADALGFYEPLTYLDWRPGDFGHSQDEADIILSARFVPRAFIAPGGLYPIDFYADYLPRSVVRNQLAGGDIVDTSPTRKYLKSIERRYGLYLDYQGPENFDSEPIVYARVYYESAPLVRGSGVRNVKFTFIKYNFVFLRSGLPARLPFYKKALAWMAGDLEKWHELDIHGAVIVALINKNGQLTPTALTLGQHNNFRTYLFGRDIPLPEDGRPKVSFALRSNEPYPAPEGYQPVGQRAVGNPADFSYVIDGGGWHLSSGVDLVFGPESGAREIEPVIRHLPDRDPLYVSWIPLGDRLKIFGIFNSFYRAGPPGMDLFTWPELKEYNKTMMFWFVDDGDEKAASLFSRYMAGFGREELKPILEYNGRRFSEEFFKLHPEAS